MKKNTKRKSKLHIKRNVRNLFIFLLVTTILGLIFMNLTFTLIMLFGIILILGLSSILEEHKKKKWFRITINTIAIFILLGSIAVIGGATWFIKYVVDNSPEFNEDALSMSQTTKIYSSEGDEIAELGTQKREIIKYENMNESLIDALIATEDSRFFQHNGFDAPRFLIASFKQGLGNSKAGGASTITMQVAKNGYNADKANLTKGFGGIARKFTDIYLAVFKLEKNYSKQEIIEFYLNNHFLGNNAYGIEQAAETYFSKHAYELNLSEASLLIGMFKAPTAYNPFTNPEAASIRRGEVLNYMVSHGYITDAQRKAANAIPVTSLLTATVEEKKYYGYLNQVVEEAINEYGVNPHTNSLLIYTNMNTQYQNILEDVMSGKTYKWENPEVQAGVAVVEAKTGKVLAIGAGRNLEGDRLYSFATKSKRQIGSSAKPIFDYGPGIEFENWSTYTLFDDSKYYYSSGQEIRDSDRQYMGIMTLRNALAMSRNIPALKAFQQLDNKQISDFAVSLGLTPELCPPNYTYNRKNENCVNTKNENDVVDTIALHEAHSIGSFTGSNPLEMAGAYAAFANGGYYNKPYTINKIIFRDTGEIITNEPENTKVMSDATAFMITDVLKTAVNSGLSIAAKVNGVNVAAKTGTTNYSTATLYANGLPISAVNDAWVVGYDPKIVVGLWYGYEPISKNYWTTNDTAFYQRRDLWAATAGKIFAKDGSDFEVPDSVIKVGVELSNDVTEEPKLPSAYTPQDRIVYEYFKKGTEPTEVSTRYMKLDNPTGFNVEYDPSSLTVNMTWNGISTTMEMGESYGRLGYKIYKNGEYIGFSDTTTYSIKNVSDPAGTYLVASGYELNDTNNSSGITYTLNYTKEAKYEASFTVPINKTYTLGDTLDNSDKNPGKQDIKLTKDGEVVTPTITVAITDENGETIANITTTEKNKYTITYNIKHETYTKSIKRTVTIVQTESNNNIDGE